MNFIIYIILCELKVEKAPQQSESKDLKET